MNNFYNTEVENLGIKQNTGYEKSVEGFEDPEEATIHKFGNHHIILKINEIVKDKNVEQFNFSKINIDKMEN